MSEKYPKRRGRPRDSTNCRLLLGLILAFLVGSKPGFYSLQEIAHGIGKPKSTVHDALRRLDRGGPIRYFPGKGWYARVHEEDVLRLLEDLRGRDVRVGRDGPQRWGKDPVEEAMLFLTNVQGRPVKNQARLSEDIEAVMYGLQGDIPEPGSVRADIASMRLSLGDADVWKEQLRR